MAWTRSICWHGRDFAGDAAERRSYSDLRDRLHRLVLAEPLKKAAALANLIALAAVATSFGLKAAPSSWSLGAAVGGPTEPLLLGLLGSSALASMLLLANSRARRTPEPASPAMRRVEARVEEQEDPAAPSGDMLDRMGHDLRTPLNAIMGFSDMMHQQMHGPLGSDRYQAYAEHIRDSSVSLLAAIESTLAITEGLAAVRKAPSEHVDHR